MSGKGVMRRREGLRSSTRRNTEAESLAYSKQHLTCPNTEAESLGALCATGSLNDDGNTEKRVRKVMEDFMTFSELARTFVIEMGEVVSERNNLLEENAKLRREIVKWAKHHETCGAHKNGVKKPRSSSPGLA